MTGQNWSKEPWVFDGPVDRHSDGVKLYPSMPPKYWEVGVGFGELAPFTACASTEANARRIVACVNACAGIPTEALEAKVIGELVEAAKGVIAYLGDDHAGACASQPTWLSGASEQGPCDCSIGQLRIALAKLQQPEATND